MEHVLFLKIEKSRFGLVEELTRANNCLQKWTAEYFLEYKGIYTHIDAMGGLLVLKQASTPALYIVTQLSRQLSHYT